MEKRYKCKYCECALKTGSVCHACFEKRKLVRELRKICEEIKRVARPKSKCIELDALNKALTKACWSNFDDGRAEFASGILLAKDIANSLPVAGESRGRTL